MALIIPRFLGRIEIIINLLPCRVFKGGLCLGCHRGHLQPADGNLPAADGSHQGDDRRAPSGEGAGRPQVEAVGADQTRRLQGRSRPS